jgi:hypothetical protein
MLTLLWLIESSAVENMSGETPLIFAISFGLALVGIVVDGKGTAQSVDVVAQSGGKLSEHTAHSVRVIVVTTARVRDLLLSHARRRALQKTEFAQQRRMIWHRHETAREQRRRLDMAQIWPSPLKE